MASTVPGLPRPRECKGTKKSRLRQVREARSENPFGVVLTLADSPCIGKNDSKSEARSGS